MSRSGSADALGQAPVEDLPLPGLGPSMSSRSRRSSSKCEIIGLVAGKALITVWIRSAT